MGTYKARRRAGTACLPSLGEPGPAGIGWMGTAMPSMGADGDGDGWWGGLGRMGLVVLNFFFFLICVFGFIIFFFFFFLFLTGFV
jgi:hypothetical protein